MFQVYKTDDEWYWHWEEDGGSEPVDHHGPFATATEAIADLYKTAQEELF